MKQTLTEPGKWILPVLFLIPVLYFLAGIYFRLLLGDPSLRSIDPEYIYFISGLSIAENHFHLGHIDNPGTPLQYLVALVFRVIYLFRSHSVTLVEDVFANPDMYLSAVNIAITAILSVSLFSAGRFVFRKTGSVIYGVLIQTIPFIPAIWYQIIGRITPELLIPVPVLLLTCFLIGWITEEKEKSSWRDLLVLSLILAFGLSIKLTMISFWILPLIIVKSWKGKLITLVLSVLFFLVLAFPVTLQLERFWHWIRDLFLFSGQYGSGERNIVETEKLRENLNQILRFERHFTYLVILHILFIPFSWFWFRKKASLKVGKKLRAATGLVLVILIQALVTGKNYEPRYFMPVVMLGPLLIWLLAGLIKEYHSHRLLNLALSLLLILFIGWHAKRQLVSIHIDSESIGNHVRARQATWHYAESLEKDAIKIIVSQDYGSPFKEYALMFSTAWADNHLKPYYAEVLGKLYPNTYQYTTWDDKFKSWGSPLDYEEIIAHKIPVYLYLQKKSDELFSRTLAKINPGNLYNVKEKEIFLNSELQEVIYELSFTEKDQGIISP